MIASVELSSACRRLLDKLLNRSGRPRAAALRAERILNALAAGNGLTTREAGSLTRFGDSRVPRCVKYKLSGGYRLICRRRGSVLVALYIGNHEECLSRLGTSRGLQGATGDVLAPDPSGEPRDRDDGAVLGLSPPVEEREYTDRELRAVFAGICGR